jgi:hypothetical protein
MVYERETIFNISLSLSFFLSSSNFHNDNEGLINRQINLELYASYVYTAMSHYFDRFDVALKGRMIRIDDGSPSIDPLD